MSRLLERPTVTVVDAPPVTARSTRRLLHPWAWWCWALLAAATVSQTRNPLLITLIVGAVIMVVMMRRGPATWARSIGVYLLLATFIITVRLFFQITVGGMRTGVVLFQLPEVQLPEWAAGIRLGGPVTLDGISFALYEGMRLAAMIICVGAANALANPKRALRSVPAALHEVSTALVIAISLAPQLVESIFRVRRARRLRGTTGRGHRRTHVTATVIPVLEDAIERSMSLAAGMEARGYGATHDQHRGGRGVTVLMVASLGSLIFGTYLLLGVPSQTAKIPGWACLLGGAALAVVTLRVSGRRLAVSHYRPDPWRAPETLVVLCGALALAVGVWLTTIDDQLMNPSRTPVEWPMLHPGMLVLAGALFLPVLLTTPPPLGES